MTQARSSPGQEEARALELLDGATILLVEDQEIVRTSLGRLFSSAFRVIEACSVEQGIGAGREALPGLDLAIVDLGLPDGTGWDVITALHASDPSLRFLVVSGQRDTEPPEGFSPELFDRILFVDKPTSGPQLLAAAAYARHFVRQAREGVGSPAGTTNERPAADASPPPEPDVNRRVRHEGLSHRESQAMRGCVLGLTNEQIAEQLGLSISSAKKYVSSGLRKLGVTSRYEVHWAVERGHENERRE
jgi:DNA-binding NarL/FixJ family response regulator